LRQEAPPNDCGLPSLQFERQKWSFGWVEIYKETKRANGKSVISVGMMVAHLHFQVRNKIGW